MNRFLKSAVLSAAAVATTLAAFSPANAGGRRDWPHHHGYQHRSDGNDIAVAGLLGLAAGALVVGLTARNDAEPSYNPYRKPRPRPIRDDYPRPESYDRMAYGAIEPWTSAWYEYCSDRYRSFKPRTGTYSGYDGREHFCVAD